MHRCDLMDPKTEEQEAINAAYIARECKRIQANWAELERQRRAYSPVPATDGTSNTGRGPELARVSIIMGRMAAKVYNLEEVFLESERIYW